ncbi:MAG: hypothetical protein P8H57_02350 [Emcibacteraceae bacterium]|nr:hypothetical protein [Emcibacteraceae bacterium]
MRNSVVLYTNGGLGVGVGTGLGVLLVGEAVVSTLPPPPPQAVRLSIEIKGNVISLFLLKMISAQLEVNNID